MRGQGTRELSPTMGMVHFCPGCRAMLSDYEVFAGRLRGLDPPVCLGCLAKALVDVRDKWLPLLKDLERKILELADLIPYERLERHG